MQPDKSEKRIRFGCGFIFGMILGFFTAITWMTSTWGIVVFVTLGAAIVFGLLARKYGDAFWHSLKNWWYWT
ncbi:MAG: hypothetical protein P8X55_10865 [Desulfosarcinaceae bacterium]